jgi:hypothetical protein
LIDRPREHSCLPGVRAGATARRGWGTLWDLRVVVRVPTRQRWRACCSSAASPPLGAQLPGRRGEHHRRGPSSLAVCPPARTSRASALPGFLIVGLAAYAIAALVSTIDAVAPIQSLLVLVRCDRHGRLSFGGGPLECVESR